MLSYPEVYKRRALTQQWFNPIIFNLPFKIGIQPAVRQGIPLPVLDFQAPHRGDAEGCNDSGSSAEPKRVHSQSHWPQKDPLRACKCRSSRFPKRRGEQDTCIWQPPSLLERAFVREGRSIFSRWLYLFTAQQPFLGFIRIYCRGSGCGSGIAPQVWWCIIISADRSACWANNNWQPLPCFHFVSAYCCVSPWWNTCRLPAG